MRVPERVELKGKQKKRADVIVAGSAILNAALDFLNLDEAFVSTKGVRFGVALGAQK